MPLTVLAVPLLAPPAAVQAPSSPKFTVLALTVLRSFPVLAADDPPDLTKGETRGVDRTRTYNPGATGLRGWIYTNLTQL